MTRIAASVDVNVPVALCYSYCRDAQANARWQAAYRSLRPGRDYSGQVVTQEQDRLLVISIAALEPVTGKQVRAWGYDVHYTFTESAEGRTIVEVAISYDLMAAVMGAGLLGYQAQNEILHRIGQLLALEAGYAGSSSGSATA